MTWHVLGMRMRESGRIWLAIYGYKTQEAAIIYADSRNKSGQMGHRFFVAGDNELHLFGLPPAPKINEGT